MGESRESRVTIPAAGTVTWNTYKIGIQHIMQDNGIYVTGADSYSAEVKDGQLIIVTRSASGHPEMMAT